MHSSHGDSLNGIHVLCPRLLYDSSRHCTINHSHGHVFMASNFCLFDFESNNELSIKIYWLRVTVAPLKTTLSKKGTESYDWNGNFLCGIDFVECYFNVFKQMVFQRILKTFKVFLYFLPSKYLEFFVFTLSIDPITLIKII